MNTENQSKVITGLLGAIILMFIVEFAFLNVLNRYVSSRTHALLIYAPFIAVIVLTIALFWLLERMPS